MKTYEEFNLFKNKRPKDLEWDENDISIKRIKMYNRYYINDLNLWDEFRNMLISDGYKINKETELKFLKRKKPFYIMVTFPEIHFNTRKSLKLFYNDSYIDHIRPITESFEPEEDWEEELDYSDYKIDPKKVYLIQKEDFDLFNKILLNNNYSRMTSDMIGESSKHGKLCIYVYSKPFVSYSTLEWYYTKKSERGYGELVEF